MSYENILMNIDYDNIDNCDNNENNDNENNELDSILKEIDESSLHESIFDAEDLITSKIIDYDTNYSVKQILLICDYYGLLKEVKINKFKKQELIMFLLDFEENIENSLIVYKRKQLWYFMDELKNDKFMKKYIIW
jgi:hypothetical protein